MRDDECSAAIKAMPAEDEARKHAAQLCAGCIGMGRMGRCATCPRPNGWTAEECQQMRVMPQPAMPPAWRLMGRANPFVPWVLLEHCDRLEDACRKAGEWKARGKFYAVHVRAN